MQHTLKTESGQYLVVDVPEGARNFRIDNDMSVIFYETNGSPYNHILINDGFMPFDYEIIGLHPGITEEQAASIVDAYKDNSDVYIDYTRPNAGFYSTFDTALESLDSLLEANRIYTVNPLELPTKEKYGYVPADSYDSESGWVYEEGEDEYNKAFTKWQAAEDRTSKLKIILKKL